MDIQDVRARARAKARRVRGALAARVAERVAPYAPPPAPPPAPPAEMLPPPTRAEMVEPSLLTAEEMAQPEDPRWATMNARTLKEVVDVPDLYRPTNFWSPALDELLAEMETMGLRQFKRWPAASWWFHPVWGTGLNARATAHLVEVARKCNNRIAPSWVASALSGVHEARRDYDAMRMAWDQDRWPADLHGIGESTIGNPWQRFRLEAAEGVGFGKPYVNYLGCLAALSRHVERAPKSFLEIGGGFGVLGEIVLSRDPEARYVNLDIPPLVTVASYYLTELFGDRVLTYDERVESDGPIDVSETSACLPNWRLRDLRGEFDVFVNSYSFQEMEPQVVEEYVDAVCATGIEWAVSLNSMKGKPKASDGHQIGVIDPVTSDRIIAMFEQHGFELQARYNRPLIASAGEIAVLRRR